MFEVTGTWNGSTITVEWDDGDVRAPDDFLSAVSFMETNVVEGPVPLVFAYPDMSNPNEAAQIIEFILGEVETSTGPVVSWDDCLNEMVPIAKHPHDDGGDQKDHGNWARGGATKTTGAPDYTPLEDAKGKKPKATDGKVDPKKKPAEKPVKKPTPKKELAQAPVKESKGPSRSRTLHIEQSAKKIDEQYDENQLFVDAADDWDETFQDTTYLHSDREVFGEMVPYMDDDFVNRLTGETVNGWEWFQENHPDAAWALGEESEYDFFRRHVIRKHIRRRSRKATGGWDEWGRKTTGKAIVKTREFLENARQFIRMDGDDLERVLMGGQVFTQHATGESNGWYDPDGRTRVEGTLFGYEGQMRDHNEQSQYPIYGYYGEDPMVWNSGSPNTKFEDEGTARWAGNLEHYGTTSIELKAGVASTFMLGDSLDDSGVPQYGQLDGFSPHAMPGDPKNPGIETVASIAGHLARSGATLPDQVRYVEAEYHEAITFDDIKAIHVPASYVEELEMTGEEFHDRYLPDHIELVVHQ